MGIYRGQVKAPNRLGMNPSLELRPGIYPIGRKRGEEAKPPPQWCSARRRASLSSAQKVPEHLDELHVAGGWWRADQRRESEDRRPAGAGGAEIVIEGWIDTEYLSPKRRSASRTARQPAGIQRLHGGDASRAGATRSSRRSSRR
jgi:3-polyprenyl-4-hydroxybenzoate decarboxylase